jgi:hypothetical protein
MSVLNHDILIVRLYQGGKPGTVGRLFREPPSRWQAPLYGARNSLGWLNADPIVHGSPQTLPASEVFLSSLQRNVTEQELDLL